MNEIFPSDPSVPPTVPVSPVITSTAPALWNPGAAAAWCLLFSPAFGAYIQGENAKALGRPDEAKVHEKWFYGTLAFLVAAVLVPFIPVLSHLPINLFGLPLLLTWYFTLGNKQVQHIKEAYGDAYPRKAWGTPLLIAGACFVSFLIVAFVFGFVFALLFGAPRI